MTSPAYRIVATDPSDIRRKVDARTSVHKTSVHKTSVHKTSVHKTSVHKTSGDVPKLPLWQRVAIIGGSTALCWAPISLAAYKTFF